MSAEDIVRDESRIPTPYYLIDEAGLLANMEKIRLVRESSGAKFLLALKCFATWGVFDIMSRYMDGTTSSSLFETRLGREKFGKEVHAYSVAFSEDEIEELKGYSDKVIFNSITQLEAFSGRVKGPKIGLRVNPGFSYSHFDLADPARRRSKLGVSDPKEIERAAGRISGAMFHYNCENDDFDNFRELLDRLGREYAGLLSKLEWVSLGGGYYFTKEGYPIDKFAEKLKDFSRRHGVQVYLEPGEAAVTQTTALVAQVLDVIHNDTDIAVVDSSIEAHMLDLLIYRTPAKMDGRPGGKHSYLIAGKSCLAGDDFGTFGFDEPLKAGDRVRFADAGGYTMVKKNWFNGLAMPSIVLKKINGDCKILKTFSYNDFKDALS